MYYVYKLLRRDGRVLYVGMTKDLSRELAYEHLKEHRKLKLKAFNSVEKIIYAEMKSRSDAELYKTYYINHHKPNYNKGWTYNSCYSFYLKEPVWEVIKVDRRIQNHSREGVGSGLDGLAGVKVDEWEYDWNGCKVLRMDGVPIHHIDVERDKVLATELPNAKYCRFIIVNGERYYHVIDLEQAIGMTPEYKKCAKVDYRKGEIGPGEYVVLYDTTLKARGHHTSRVPVRFASDKWLSYRIIKQVEANKKTRVYGYSRTGWTRDLVYLAEDVLLNKEYIMEHKTRSLDYLGRRDRRMKKIQGLLG